MSSTRDVHRSSLLLMGGASLLCCTGTAQAQDWSGVQRGHDQAVSAKEGRPERSRDHIVVGIGGGYSPAYQGADGYRVVPLPAIDISLGGFFANLRNGVGYRLMDADGISVGVSATYMPGYRTRSAPDGIGGLSVGLGARVFTIVKAGGLIGTLGATKGVLGDNKGVVADASLSYPLPVTPRLTIIPTAGTTLASDAYNDRYFGVNAAQSFASSLPSFRPKGGIKDVSVVLSANYRLSSRVNFGVSGGVTSLMGDAADSPIVYNRTQPSGFVSLSYRFGR